MFILTLFLTNLHKALYFIQDTASDVQSFNVSEGTAGSPLAYDVPALRACVRGGKMFGQPPHAWGAYCLGRGITRAAHAVSQFLAHEELP